jgi:hypothetical protein
VKLASPFRLTLSAAIHLRAPRFLPLFESTVPHCRLRRLTECLPITQGSIPPKGEAPAKQAAGMTLRGATIRKAFGQNKNERPSLWLHFVTWTDRAATAAQSDTPGNRSPKES